MTRGLSDYKEIRRAEEWLKHYWDRSTGPEYYHASTIDEVVGLLNEYGKEAKIIAGGVDLLGLIKNKITQPQTFINIKNIPDLRYIRENEKGLAIGALTRINDIQRSAVIKSKYPILYETAGAIASPQIRNMATLGGNLCQEVRCWYYRRSPDTGIDYHCRRKIETGQCYAVDGENQYHAIIDGIKCVAVCGSDMATTLLALDARIKTASIDGGRSLQLDELYTPLGNTLKQDEVITMIQIPSVTPDIQQRFLKFRIRKAIDFAIVSAAAVIKVKDNIVTDSRIVLGGVAYKPYRALEAEKILKGERIAESLALAAAKAALIEASPLSKNAYKVTIASTLVKRAILNTIV